MAGVMEREREVGVWRDMDGDFSFISVQEGNKAVEMWVDA